MKPSYYILTFITVLLYFLWYLNYSNLPEHPSKFIWVILTTFSILQAFLPGAFCALIVFLIFPKQTKTEKVYISFMLLFLFLFLLGSLNILGMQHPEVFFFTLICGFIGIKSVENNIEKFHTKEI